MIRALFAGLLFTAAASGGIAAPQETGPFTTARNLYASARYDEALTVLDGLRSAQGVDRKSVEEYRSLCLLALGRASEAESAIAAVVAADPLYRPGDDASPRVRALFSDVRKRMLPEIVTARYTAAKATFDRQDWTDAQRQFRIVLTLIDDPDTVGSLKDLRLLTVGFLELSARAAAAPPPQPAKAEAPSPETQPASAAAATGSPATTSSPVGTADPSVAADAGPIAGKVYGPDDADVAPPVIVRQEIPSVPAAAITTARARGLLEITVDEKGRVIGMAMRASIHPMYDTQLLVAARDWKYKPATMNGQPVRYRKLIQVSVKR